MQLDRISSIILISEDFNGHRLSYLADIVERCNHARIALYIVALEIPLLGDSLDTTGVKLKLVSGGRKEIFMQAIALQREIPKSRIVSWEIERWYKFLSWNRVPLVGLAMRPYVDFGKPSAFINSLLKRTLNTFFSLRPEVQIRGLSIPNQTHFKSSKWVDELPQKPKALIHPGKSDHKKNKIIFGVFGAISSRKRPIECIQFAESVSTDLDMEVEIQFVGKIGQDIQTQTLRSELVEVTILNNYLSDDEYLQAMESIDYILCFYTNIGSARTPIEAISTGTCCIFLDNSKRWAKLERDFPANFVRIGNLNQARIAFERAEKFSPFRNESEWIPQRDTWLDYLVCKAE